MVNSRKEFFFATPAQVRAALAVEAGNPVEVTESAAATEYLQSVRYWSAHASTGPRASTG